MTPTAACLRPPALLLCIAMMLASLAPAASAQAPAAESGDAARRVLIVSIDGLRPDLALYADAPNIRSLMKGGAYTMWAHTLPIGKTLPSHTSMVTGVPLEQHGVFWNDDVPARPRKYDHPQVPTLFDLAKKQGYTTALAAGKYKFVAFAREGVIDHLILPEMPARPIPGRPSPPQPRDEDGLTEYSRQFSDQWVADEAARIITEHKPGLMMVHFARVDTVGHARGWGSPNQLRAVEAADKALGAVLDAMRQADVFDSTLIILSADHGGFGNTHHGKDPRGLHIPWIAHGPGVKQGYDLNRDPKHIVNTMDTFATAANHLGLKLPGDAEYEGVVVTDAFEPRAAKSGG